MHSKMIIVCVSVALSLAASHEAEAKRGFYLGLGAVYNTIDGDFTGTRGLQGGNDIIILPKIESGFGFDVRTGYGFNDQWAIELNLMSSRHDGAWAGLTGRVDYTSFSVNGKYTISPSDAVQPYVLIGFGHNELFIRDGAADTWTGEVTDATLSGPGAQLGIGIDAYLSAHVSLNIGFLYRYVEYTEAEGAHNSGTIDDGVDGSGVSGLVTMAYHF